MRKQAPDPAWGIAHFDRAYNVVLGDRVVAGGHADAASVAALVANLPVLAVVRATYAASTGRELGEPLVLDLRLVCWWVEDDGVSGVDPDTNVAALAEEVLEASRADDPLLLNAFAQGGLAASAAIPSGWLSEWE